MPQWRPAVPRRARRPNWISPDVGRLVGELRGHEGEVLPHLDPEVGFGDAAVVRVDGMDTSHLSGYESGGGGRGHTAD